MMRKQRPASSVQLPVKVRSFSSMLAPRPSPLAASHGFTLVETLVAITLITIAIVAPMALTVESLKSAYYSRDQIIAANLAQEGLEFVRARRDHNILTNIKFNPVDMLAGIPIGAGHTFTVDVTKSFTEGMQECDSGSCPSLETDGRLYGYGLGSPTPFTRTVLVTYVNPTNQDEIRVEVTVSWKTGSYQTRQFTLSENLLRWVVNN
jgi:prepilin-type N-terminal cleavage/methylation domain-containing protein